MEIFSVVMVITIHFVTDDLTVYEERAELRGKDVIINCSVSVSVEQSNTIVWTKLYPNTLISESLKYTLNITELTIHNVSADDAGEYACYSEEVAIAYTIINVTVACK